MDHHARTLAATMKLQTPTAPWRALAQLTEVSRRTAEVRDFEARLPDIAAALSNGMRDQTAIWVITPGGSRMRTITATSNAGPWRPTAGPIAQVLAARQAIEMGLVEDPLERDDVTLGRFDGTTIRFIGRFVPVFSASQIIAVVGCVRAADDTVFTAAERVILDAAAERVESAFALCAARDSAAGRSAPGVVRSNGLVLADDLLTRLGAISGDVVFRHLFSSGTEYISDGITTSLGYTPQEIVGDPLLLDRLIHPDDRHLVSDMVTEPSLANRAILIRMVRRNGQVSWQLLRVSPILDPSGRVLGIEGFATDVTTMKEAEAELAHQVRSDPLTGLANRLNFRESTSRALARIERHPGMMGVLFLDLDGFKAVNDSLGHAAGDEVLIQVAQRLRRAIRREDMVARLGGDEFAVLLVELRDVSEAAATARRILESLEENMFIGNHVIQISTGVGIAVTDQGSVTPDELINRADVALYQAKRAGRGRWQVFEGPNGSIVTTQASLPLEDLSSDATTRPTPRLTESALRASLAAGDFRVRYLPEIDTHTGAISSVEALVRWQHPELGLLPAAAFINEVGAMDVIHPLGDWVLRESCRQVMTWQRRFELPLTLWVNVSPVQLLRPGFADTVLATLAAVGFAPRDLGLDIPESALTNLSPAGEEAVAALHRAGVKIAIDDFGIGATTLRSLRRLPLSQIKIDRSLMSDVDRPGSSDSQLVQLAVRLAGSLGADAVAVGVERTSQLEQLRALQCAYYQGFLAGEARTAEEISQLLAQAQLPLPGVHESQIIDVTHTVSEL